MHKKILKIAGAKPVLSPPEEALERAIDAMEWEKDRLERFEHATNHISSAIRVAKGALPKETAVELELKLVQDTRINPEVIHLFLRGHDSPLMSFGIKNGKLVYRRYSGTQGKPMTQYLTTAHSDNGIVLKEDFSVPFDYQDYPTSAEAFGEDSESSHE